MGDDSLYFKAGFIKCILSAAQVIFSTIMVSTSIIIQPLVGCFMLNERREVGVYSNYGEDIGNICYGQFTVVASQLFMAMVQQWLIICQ